MVQIIIRSIDYLVYSAIRFFCMEKAVDAKKKDFCMEKHKKAVDCKNGEK